MQLGATLSHPHSQWLDENPLEMLEHFKRLGLSWVRLGSYWRDIEQQKGQYNFSELDRIIEKASALDLKIVLTVGMKAPRFPEYYLPSWYPQNWKRLASIGSQHEDFIKLLMEYVEKTVTRYKPNKQIVVWQIENEPLDPSGEKWWRISPDLVEKEVERVRESDSSRKIMVTLWGNELSKRKLYKKAITMADIVGIDLYLRHPMFFVFNFLNKYVGPLDSQEKLKSIRDEIVSSGKEFWIAELQSEPWEANELVSRKENPPSFLPDHFEQNLLYGKGLSPNVLLLWGFEWWYQRMKKGDTRYWEKAQLLLKKT